MEFKIHVCQLLIVSRLLVLIIVILPKGAGCFWRIPDPSLSELF